MKERYYYSIASGSGGNCSLYVSGGTAVLFDLGVSVRRLRQALGTLGMDVPDLAGVLITHEHIDHVKGLATFVKKYDVAVYATGPTARELVRKTPPASDKLRPFFGGEAFPVGGLSVQSFLTPHDAAESVGYVLRGTEGALGFATDLGFMPSQVKKQLTGCDTVVLESNHDPVMLQNGPYPWPLQQRVGGAQGHLSNPDCAACAAELAQAGTRTLILAHLSEHNNTPVTAFRETRRALDQCGAACELYVAPKDAMEAPVLLDAEGRVCCL